MNNTKVFLVIGGSGFIGTNLVNHLLRRGSKVFSADVIEPMDKSHSNLYRYCDLLNFDSVDRLLKTIQPTYIVNLAARTDLLGSELSDYAVNTVGVENLCRALAGSEFVERVVFASTMLVCKVGHIPATVTEFSADTVYGQSKIEGETIVRRWATELPSSVIIRPTSIWGPWFEAPYRSFFERVLSGHFFNIKNCNSSKTYGFVGNAAQEITALAEDKKIELSELVYIGDRPAMSVKSWSSLICEVDNAPPPIQLPQFVFWLAAKVGDFLKLVGKEFPMTSFRLNNMTSDNDLSKLTSSLSRKSTLLPIKEGIRETIEWLQCEDR